MARMHPDDIEGSEKATPGERTVFRFLQEAARPDSDFIGWYEPAIGEQGREPDFLRLANSLSTLYPKGSDEKRL